MQGMAFPHFCVAGHTTVEREFTARAPGPRVCPDRGLGNARSGPRVIGHVERHLGQVVAQVHHQALDQENLAQLQKTFLLGVFKMGRSAPVVQFATMLSCYCLECVVRGCVARLLRGLGSSTSARSWSFSTRFCRGLQDIHITQV